MLEIRKDVIRDNWVITANEFVVKPRDFPIKKNDNKSANPTPTFNHTCPFCEGNETMTTDEILAFRKEGTQPNTPGWTVRTILNKFSALELKGELDMKEDGIYKHCNGLGQHEVLVETPLHGEEFHQLPVERIESIYKMMQIRYKELAADERIKYIQIYKNRGLFAGASLEHSHSQIVSFPMLPVNKAVMQNYFQEYKQCIVCEMIETEKKDKQRVLFDGQFFLVICPYASRFAYETWIIPKRHVNYFGDITEEEIKELAILSKKVISAMMSALHNPSYNMVINTAPINVPNQEGYHWHLEINPRLLVNAGVEVATGYFINPAAPEMSAAALRKILAE